MGFLLDRRGLGPRPGPLCAALATALALLVSAGPARAASDEIVAARADGGGYHILRATSSSGWSWQLVATLQPGGTDADAWTGYHCVAGGGRYVVAVVAPRAFVNVPALRDRAGIAYAVDTRTGSVRPLVAGVAVKYHTPGCGAGRLVALTRHLGVDQRRSEVLLVDPARARVVRRIAVAGQITSAVPVGRSVVAAKGAAIVRLGHGRPKVLARVPGQAYMLTPNRSALDYLVARAGRAEVWRLRGSRAARVGHGPLRRVRLYRGTKGSLVVGARDLGRRARLRGVAAPPTGAPRQSSLRGRAILLDTPAPPLRSASGHSVSSTAPALWLPARNRVVRGSLPRQTVEPFVGVPDELAPGAAVASLAANTTTPKCAVPRNDLRRQVPQPNAKQIDWAVQQATRNLLKGTILTRPANFLNLGLVAYQPSLDFPRNALRGGTTEPVPRSVIEAVFAQESAWRHASPRALPGVSGNPYVADYYGAGGTLDVIDYNGADCGYGVSQVTDPMTAAGTAYSANGKTKVAVDYAENVAAGIQFLVDKWNQLHDAGVTLNGGNPRYLENWYFAIWAYNTGFYAKGASGPWGLGWTNNPMNGDYCPCRTPFLRVTYADAEHPSDWPYQERVVGWMETPLLDYRGKAAYPYPNGSSRQFLKVPSYTTFCAASNECDPSWHDPTRPANDRSVDYCKRPDRKCWWNKPVTYATCPSQCRESTFTVATTAKEPANDDNYPPQCTSSLPAGTIIVDDQPSNLNVEGCTSVNWTSAGSFSVAHGQNAAGVLLGVIDWHQLGTGFGGHMWFTKARAASDAAHVNTATWTPPALNGVYTIRAHVPPSGASTSVALYRIHRGDGTSVTRVVDQHLHENRWIPLGSFRLYPGAKVVLTNATSGNRLHEGGPLPEEEPGSTNVAFDALAFTPAATTDDAIAQRFRPIMRFDSGENWRPLNVETFFAETFADGQPGSHHRVCASIASPGVSCREVTTWRDLRLYGHGVGWPESAWPYVDVHGEGDDVGRFKTPNQSCAPGALNDCDVDSTYTSAYWHRVGPFPSSRYVYYDYWFFYRFNKAAPNFDHEADWEWVTVAHRADDPDPKTFDFVALSAHGASWHYLKKVLTCDGATASGSCGSTAKRVHAMVAEGTHAQYPVPCVAASYCSQTTATGSTSVPPERPHDGTRYWGANNDAQALRPFPEDAGWEPSVLDRSWVDWPGWWGWIDTFTQPGKTYVKSPAAARSDRDYLRPHASIRCTERHTAAGVDCNGAEGPGAAVPLTALSANVCAPWAGPDVAAAVCDPDALRSALREGTVGEASNVSLDADGRGRVFAAGDGIAQLVGRPLEPGEAVAIAGDVEPDAVLTLRVREGSHVLRMTFRGVESSAGSGVRLTFARPADPRSALLVTPDGSAHRPAAVRVER